MVSDSVRTSADGASGNCADPQLLGAQALTGARQSATCRKVRRRKFTQSTDGEPARESDRPSPIKSVTPKSVDPDPAGLSATQLATRALLRKAEEARHDVSKFYEFTIRHETTKRPLKPAPHQRLMFTFVMDHEMCVVRQPIGTGKTFGMTAIGLFLTGTDVTQRGAIVSKAQGQASKVLRMVDDYITDPNLSAPVKLVFPWLEKSKRPGEPWTQSAITVDRPAGIRDPSLVAVGLDGAIQGARLSWVLGDDILDADNTLTAAGREQTHSRFDSRILSRLDPTGGRAVVTNTPWDLQDLTYKLEQVGWPTMSMDIYGNIWFSSKVSEEWIRKTGLLRPSNLKAGCWRLVEFDPDPTESTPLWPERYSLETIKKIRDIKLPHEFARLFLCHPFDEQAMRCQKDWIDKAKQAGRGMLFDLGKPREGLPVYTGVDIGIGDTSHHDLSSLFTFQLLEDGRRLVIDIESGRWSGPVIAEKVIEKHDRFGGVISVESNTAQDFIRQFVLRDRPTMRIRAHSTNKATKYNVDFGVESIFTEFKHGLWIVPCDNELNTHPEIDRWLEACLYYQPPPAHTDDRIMACWIARECSRRGGGGRDPKPHSGGRLNSWRGGGF
jgi:hypothetical protein